MTATPAKHLAVPPYTAEHFGCGLAGVMNANGVNCLTFSDKPGVVLTDFERAKDIAMIWNEGANK